MYRKIIDFETAKRLSYVRNEDTLKWLDEQVGDTLKTVEEVYPGYINKLLKRSAVNESKRKRLESKKNRMRNELTNGTDARIETVGEVFEVVEQLSLFEVV